MKGLYHEFRHEIDELAYPLIVSMPDVRVKGIYDGSECVGFMLVEGDYIDALYVREGHRRKGLARKAVIEYVREYGLPRSLHIVNTNKAAKRFWNGIFKLRVLERNEVDTLYEVEDVYD